jgi:hypothetical protein
MKSDLINALKKEGRYVFLVEVRRESNGAVMRNDDIELDENDVDNIDVQNQIDDYMSQNNVRKISLNDKVVWEAPKRTVINITGQFGKYCSI